VGGSLELDNDSEPGFILATADGGRHWTTQLVGAHDDLNAVSFVDSRHGWAAGNRGVLYRTSDGGDTWRLVHLQPSGQLQSVCFSDRSHGWAVMSHVALLATTDGGSTWAVVKTAKGVAPLPFFFDVACRDDGVRR